jgi:hypothetical protein
MKIALSQLRYYSLISAFKAVVSTLKEFFCSFQLPYFVIGLAKPPQEVVRKLPVNDSRHRADYPLLEKGLWKEVSTISHAIRLRTRINWFGLFLELKAI